LWSCGINNWQRCPICESLLIYLEFHAMSNSHKLLIGQLLLLMLHFTVVMPFQFSFLLLLLVILWILFQLKIIFDKILLFSFLVNQFSLVLILVIIIQFHVCFKFGNISMTLSDRRKRIWSEM
jgi:hypothetical protein